MKNFNEFKIKSTLQSLVGTKMNIVSILNRMVIVTDFRIEDSKYGAGKKCLYLQVEVEKEKKIIFIGSKSLIDMIEQVPKSEFPFSTTIIKDNGRYEFS